MKEEIKPIFDNWLMKHQEPYKTENFSETFHSEPEKWDFYEVITDERRESFEAGFKSAVRLLIG